MQDTPASHKPMRRMMTALFVGGMLMSTLAGCSAEDDDRIIGVWHWPEQSVYENLDEDGQWGVFTNSDIVGDPYDWGILPPSMARLSRFTTQRVRCVRVRQPLGLCGSQMTGRNPIRRSSRTRVPVCEVRTGC